MLKSYLDPHADALDGWEFLTIIEAAEVGHWNVLKVMNDRAGDQAITELVTWALPIQQRHYSDASEGAKQLAADTDPARPAYVVPWPVVQCVPAARGACMMRRWPE